jgi:hypothetical protein
MCSVVARAWRQAKMDLRWAIVFFFLGGLAKDILARTAESLLADGITAAFKKAWRRLGAYGFRRHEIAPQAAPRRQLSLAGVNTPIPSAGDRSWQTERHLAQFAALQHATRTPTEMPLGR